MNYFESIQRWFLAQSRTRQWALATGLALIITLTTLGIFWVTTPTYGVLFNHLDAQDASKIIARLEESNTPYQVSHQGGEILINKELIAKTRIQLLGSDLKLTGHVGFELFDKNDFGMTDFSQKINYQRALQGELERTIGSLDEIAQARVHLVIPETHLFEQPNNLPRAAVTLHLKKTLTALQVKSIQQLIAASVPKLPPQNVVIVDQDGNNLITTEDDLNLGRFTEKKKIEHYLNEKVTQMLKRIFNRQDFMVKIDVTLNYDELQRELEKPQQDGLIVHEKETQHSTQNKTGKQRANQDFTREKSYQFGREKEHFTRANGTIERLTVSVVLPQDTQTQQITQVERLVKSVVGFNAKRGDSISVEALIVASKPMPLAVTQPTQSKPTPNKAVIVTGAVLAVLVLLTLYLHRKVRKRRRELLFKTLNQWLIENE